MTDLPININSAPAKPVAGKQAANLNASHSDANEFGNMLARQVEDTAKPDTVNLQSTVKPEFTLPDEQQAAEPSPSTEVANTIPADMLAALMVQQNIPATPAPASRTQADATEQSELPPTITGAMPFVATPSGLPDKKMATASPAIQEKKFSNPVLPDMESSSPRFANVLNEGKGFSETTKAVDVKEFGLPAVNTAPRSGMQAEAPLTPQLNGSIPVLSTVAAHASPDRINTALNQPAWADEFSQKITWMASQRNQSAELHLNPPQLGPLDVVLKMNGDQASAVFTSPHAAVRDAIEQAIPQLREMLADSGIMLGNATVNDQTANKNQDSAARKSPANKPNSPSETSEITGGIHEVRPSVISRHKGMVDTFA